MTTHPTIAALVAPVIRPPRPADVTENEWHGYDIAHSTGVIRFYAEGADPGEDFDIVSLSRSGVVQWSARFSASTPRHALAGFVAEALS